MPLTENERGAKRQRLNVRATVNEVALLTTAADELGVSVSAFVRSSATSAARQVLADRRQFVLSDDAWKVFTDALEAPPEERPRLRKLMESTTVLDGD